MSSTSQTALVEGNSWQVDFELDQDDMIWLCTATVYNDNIGASELVVTRYGVTQEEAFGAACDTLRQVIAGPGNCLFG